MSQTLSAIISELETKVKTTTNVTELINYQFELLELYGYVSNAKLEAMNKIVLASNFENEPKINLKIKYTRLAMQTQTGVSEAVVKQIDELMEEASAQKNHSILANAIQLKAFSYNYIGSPQEGEALFLKSEEIFLNTNSNSELVIHYCMKYLFYSEIDLIKAGSYIQKAIHIAQDEKVNYLIAYALLNLGLWQGRVDNLEASNESLIACYKMAETEGAYVVGYYACDQLSRNYRQKNDLVNQEVMVRKGIEFAEKTEDIGMIPSGLRILTDLLIQQENHEEAETTIDRCIALCQQENLTNELGIAIGLKGNLLDAIDKPFEAIELLEKSISIREKNIRPLQLDTIQTRLCKLFAKTKQFEKAYEIKCKNWEYKEKTLDEKRSKEIAEMEAKYETEKKDAAIKQLQIEGLNSELKAIKAQMNPHFIFNALNSIQELFFSGDKLKASKQVSRFGELMRGILNASNAENISLGEEIKMMTNYLELESIRFEENTFEYSIENNIDEFTQKWIKFPSMLIQPYIENAIKHGLLHQVGNKKLMIAFDYNEERKMLTCVIDDNGIGRAASAKIYANRKDHISFATLANEKRLSLLNLEQKQEIGVCFEDLETGTKVTINIPTL